MSAFSNSVPEADLTLNDFPQSVKHIVFMQQQEMLRHHLPGWRQIEAAGVQWRTYRGLFVHSWKGPAERRKLFRLCWGSGGGSCGMQRPWMLSEDSPQPGMRVVEFCPGGAIMPGGESYRRWNSAVFCEWTSKLQVALFSFFGKYTIVMSGICVKYGPCSKK